MWNSVILIIVTQLIVQASSFSTLVLTDKGPVNGHKTTSVDGKCQVIEFLGIPYAKPPLGTLRFAKPVAADAWTTTLEAATVPKACLQPPSPIITSMSEDCLYLSLWRPDNDYASLLSVIVFFHGGDWFTGSGNIDIYQGSVLSCAGQVIVITFNFRLNYFGFITDGTSNAPGNLYLWDQLFVLQWIQRNIAAFGGDPNSVTIMGRGSGSVNTGIFLISPAVNSVFQKAIMVSGSPYEPGLPSTTAAIATSNTVANNLGCTTNIITCLRGKTATTIANYATTKFRASVLETKPMIGDEFLPLDAYRAFLANSFKKNIPLLIGYNNGDGSYLVSQKCGAANPGFQPLNPTTITRTDAKQCFQTIFAASPFAAQLATYFMSIIPTSLTSNSLRQAVSYVVGNVFYICPSIIFGEHYAIGNTVFGYRLTQKPAQSVHTVCTTSTWMDVCHGDEVIYIFGYPFRHPSLYTTADLLLSYEMIQIWSNFAYLGVPTRYWPPFESFAPGSNKIVDLNYQVLNLYSQLPAAHSTRCPSLQSIFEAAILLQISLY